MFISLRSLEILTNQNCQFSPQRILYCKDEKTDKQFDFNNEQLEIIDDLIDNILKMLSAREEQRGNLSDRVIN